MASNTDIVLLRTLLISAPASSHAAQGAGAKGEVKRRVVYAFSNMPINSHNYLSYCCNQPVRGPEPVHELNPWLQTFTIQPQ